MPVQLNARELFSSGLPRSAVLSLQEAVRASNVVSAGAIPNQTAAEIQTAYESVATAYTSAEQTKLAGIEAGATADQTGAEIKTAYEAEADTNAFTDAAAAKVAAIVVADLIVRNGSVPFTGPPAVPSYTVATLPTVGTAQIIYVSDETGGAVLAFSDGTNWRRVTDRAVVS